MWGFVAVIVGVPFSLLIFGAASLFVFVIGARLLRWANEDVRQS